MILLTLRRRSVASASLFAAGVLSAPLFSPCDAQNREEREVRIARTPGGVTILRGAPSNRAVLGVTMGEGSRADTAGVRLEAVTADSPAGKAGLKAGDLITDINGTSLKVSREDAEDLALAGLAQRRLQRVMSKVKPGDDVRLQVRSGNATRSVTVKAASVEELERTVEKIEERVVAGGPNGPMIERRVSATKRGMVGVSIGGAGNARDTLGLFVSSVVSGGPAEKAGIVEGERIAAVNGTDVRVPREDVDDAQAASARTDRFVREVQKVEPGKTLTFKVWGNGRYRDVTVTAQEAQDMPAGAFTWETPLMNGRVPGMRFEAMPQGEVRIRRNGGEPQLFEFRSNGSEPQVLERRRQSGEPQVFEFRRNGGEPQVFEFRRDGANGRIRLNGREIEIDGAGIERAMEEMGRTLRDRLRDVEVDVRGLRTLPERSGAVRVRSTRTAV